MYAYTPRVKTEQKFVSATAHIGTLSCSQGNTFPWDLSLELRYETFLLLVEIFTR